MPPTLRLPSRAAVRYVPLVLLGCAFAAFVMSSFDIEWRSMLVGAFIGLCCLLSALAGERMLRRWFEKKPEAWWRRAIVYFMAGQIAWPVALVLSIWVLYGAGPGEIRFPRQLFVVTLGLGTAGTLVGLGMQAYETMKERLRHSIEALKEKEFAEKELHLARELQARMLPAPEIAADGYRISGRNFAARYVAGDFYDVFPFADGAVGVAVADVAGKGLPASLIMASVKAVLPLLAATRSVDEAMMALNEKLAGELSKREFVALLLARYEPASGTVTVANAGLPDPYVVRRDGAVDVIEVPGPRLPLGLKRPLAYQKRQLTLGHGEALMMFSDGLPEATVAGGDQVGYDRLVEIVRDAGMNVDEIFARLHAAEADAREDDQTLVMIERV